MPILTDRKKQIYALYIQGMTYAQIGKELGITPQGAQRQIAPPRGLVNRIRKRAKGQCEKCGIYCRLGHIHHDRDFIVTIDEVNTEKSLKYLCPSCHAKLHNENS